MTTSNRILLGVNIDHVATLRQAKRHAIRHTFQFFSHRSRRLVEAQQHLPGADPVKAALDAVGNKVAKSEIAQIKVVAPNVALKVIDRAIQIHGGAGVLSALGHRYRGAGRDHP